MPRGNETHPAAKVKLFVYETLDGSRVQATDKLADYIPFNIFTAAIISLLDPRTPVTAALPTFEKAPLPIILNTLTFVLVSSQLLVLGVMHMRSLTGGGNWAVVQLLVVGSGSGSGVNLGAGAGAGAGASVSCASGSLSASVVVSFLTSVSYNWFFFFFFQIKRKSEQGLDPDEIDIWINRWIGVWMDGWMDG